MLFGVREVMPEEVPGLQRRKPSLMVLGGGGGGSLLVRGSVKQTARVAAGGCVPVGLLEHPFSACSSASLPWDSPRCLGAPRMGLGLGRRLLLATATGRQPAPQQSPPAAATAPRTRDAQPLRQWHWWVLRCGLCAPALPGWTTLLGWFVEATGVQSCAPPWGQSKLWVFILHWQGGRWPRLCHTGVFLHLIAGP